MKEYEELTPPQQRAVRNMVARMFMIFGICFGGVVGRPASWWVSLGLLLYAMGSLFWAALHDEELDDQTANH